MQRRFQRRDRRGAYVLQMQPLDWQEMWSPTWSPTVVAVRALVVYLMVQVMFRIVGRKELARYSTFVHAWCGVQAA